MKTHKLGYFLILSRLHLLVVYVGLIATSTTLNVLCVTQSPFLHFLITESNSIKTSFGKWNRLAFKWVFLRSHVLASYVIQIFVLNWLTWFPFRLSCPTCPGPNWLSVIFHTSLWSLSHKLPFLAESLLLDLKTKGR